MRRAPPPPAAAAAVAAPPPPVPQPAAPDDEGGRNLGPTFAVWRLAGTLDADCVDVARHDDLEENRATLDPSPRVFTLVADADDGPLRADLLRLAFARDEKVRLTNFGKKPALVGAIPDAWVYKGKEFYSYLKGRPASDLKRYLGML